MNYIVIIVVYYGCQGKTAQQVEEEVQRISQTLRIRSQFDNIQLESMIIPTHERNSRIDLLSAPQIDLTDIEDLGIEHKQNRILNQLNQIRSMLEDFGSAQTIQDLMPLDND